MLTLTDWEDAGGARCSKCKGDTVRLIGSLCPICHQKVEKERVERLERRAMKRYYTGKLKEGGITLSQMRRGDL